MRLRTLGTVHATAVMKQAAAGTGRCTAALVAHPGHLAHNGLHLRPFARRGPRSTAAVQRLASLYLGRMLHAAVLAFPTASAGLPGTLSTGKAGHVPVEGAKKRK